MIRTLVPGAIAVFVAASALPREARAQAADELTIGLSAGATHSDNIHRTPDNEESETSIDAGLQLALDRQGGRLRSNVAADARFLTYLDDTYEDELVGGLDAEIVYWFAPERFSWVIEDNFGQSFIDPREVETPGNRQNTNYFSTGPDLIFGSQERTQVSLQARWSDASYEESETDNQRVSGTLSLMRRLGPRSSVSLNGTTERVEYDEEIFDSDYDQHSASVGFDARGARTTLRLEAGYTTTEDSVGDGSDAPLFNVSITRELTARSSFTLDAGTGIADTAESFRRDRAIRGVTVGNEDAIVSRDPYESDYASLGWDLTGTRNTLQIAADWRRENHEREDALNRDSIGASFQLSRHMGSRLTATLDGRWEREDFDQSGVDFDEWSGGLGFEWAVSRHLSVDLHGEHAKGSGDTLAGTGARDYAENRATVSLSYTPRR